MTSLDIMLRCMFGYKWLQIPNTFPESAGISTRVFVATFLFWLIELPFMCIHPSKIRILFLVKAAFVPFACIGLWVWALKNAHGAGAFEFSTTARGSQLGWAVVSGINAATSYSAATIVNQPDLARWAKTPRAQILGQIWSLPLANVFVGFLGSCVASAGNVIFGKVYWNPWDLLNAMLDEHWNAAYRTGVWFVAFAFAFAALGINIGSNSLPFGSDVTGLLPRYINIVRGQILCCCLGLAIVPWKILASAASFLNFLSGYALFMAPITGAMLADYFIVRRGNIDVISFYRGNSTSAYWFWHGINLRAIVAYFCGWALPLAGFIRSFHPQDSVNAADHMYALAFTISFLMAAVVYTSLCYIFPVKLGIPSRTLAFEQWAKDDGILIDGKEEHFADADKILSVKEQSV